MKYIGIEVMLNFLMLALMAIAAPAISTSEEPNAVPLNLISYPTPDTSTITSVSPQGIEYIQLGDKDFQPCFPNFGQAIMCTINYISHPSWNNEVQPFMYDNECKRIGENYHAPRSMLAAKWGWRMTSELPNYLVSLLLGIESRPRLKIKVSSWTMGMFISILFTRITWGLIRRTRLKVMLGSTGFSELRSQGKLT
ncbi:hypothetical protein ONS96_003065 [Cadophora gregata f. sp. sojae]|nr:hypothetical protein ONS96_003065 [Cadophora gregata f. sp. sojae]